MIRDGERKALNGGIADFQSCRHFVRSSCQPRRKEKRLEPAQSCLRLGEPIRKPFISEARLQFHASLLMAGAARYRVTSIQVDSFDDMAFRRPPVGEGH